MNFEPGPAESTGVEATPNLVQRVIMVFTAPTNLGAALRRSSPWFWTLAILAIISAVVYFLLPADLLQSTLEAQARARPQGQEAPDPEAMLRMARIFGPIGALVGSFVAAAVVAGVLYLAFNVMFGQDTTYKQHLSATAHTYWIGLLGFFVVLPVWLSKGEMTTQLGLGLLLTEAPQTFVGYLLNSITLFGLWSSAALGAVESGLSGGRISAGKGIGTVLALYCVWVLFSAARQTLFGA
jgi:hypothetical protein